MYKEKRIGVVVPAYNEERFIADVVRTMPPFVDAIFVVDDASRDRTSEILAGLCKPRLTVIRHERNRGAGAAMLTGYKKACQESMDVVVIMAGDGQMDPAILEQIIDPVCDGLADYCKGDRLSRAGDSRSMPPLRRFGNTLLTYIIKVASGYRHINDPLNGYTAATREALLRLDLDRVEPGYAFETDLLIKFNAAGVRAMNVPMPARYGAEKSKIRYHKFILYTSWVILRDYIWRLSVQRRGRRGADSRERGLSYVESSGDRRWSDGRESRPDIY